MEQPTIPVHRFLLIKQNLAIAYKKILFIRRSWIKFLVHSSLPIIACLIAVYAGNSVTSGRGAINYDSKLFDISASHIPNPIIILSINSTVPEPDSEKLIKIFENYVKSENAIPVILQNESLFEC